MELALQKGSMKQLSNQKKKISERQIIEYKFTTLELMNSIRFEMNIMQPGSFWIDDIKIEKISPNNL